MQAEKWQKDLAVYRDINTTFIIEGNVSVGTNPELK